MTAKRFGDFELQLRVGRDGPFLLFRARQVSLDRAVMLKVLPARLATLERSALLRREAAAADKLDHPGILRVYETGEASGNPYIVLAPVDGSRLAERLEGSALPPRLAVDLARQLAEALAHAHERNVLHGSLRPEAVWVTRDGQARLAGFGCPVQFEEMDAEMVGDFAGYLAPEQAGGRGAVGRRTDVYGLGALLYAMATGGPPHRGATVTETCRLIRSQPPVRPSRLHPGLSPALDEVCLKCLHLSPSRRYSSDRPLAKLLADLRRARLGRADPDPWDQFVPWLRRHSRLIRTAVLLVLFAAIPAGWDRMRHRAAWDCVTQPDAGPEQSQRAARHFERLAADRPFDPEAAAGLALARFRAGQWPAEPPRWRLVTDEWAAVQELTRILAAVKRNHPEEAKTALRAAKAVGYTPRCEAERRLLSECERALAEKS